MLSVTNLLSTLKVKKLYFLFLCFSNYAALTSGWISLQIQKFEIRGKIAENDMIGWEKYWKKWGLMNACQILMNPYQSLPISYKPYDLLTINLLNFLQIIYGCHECLRMLL